MAGAESPSRPIGGWPRSLEVTQVTREQEALREQEHWGQREMLDHLNHSIFLDLLVNHDGNREAGDDGRVIIRYHPSNILHP